MLREIDAFKKCEICGEEFDTPKEFIQHLNYHSYTKKRYYLEFVKKEGEEFCKLCGKDVEIIDTLRRGEKWYGYKDFCTDCNTKGYTLQKCVLMYGEELGNVAWKEYCDKQANSNTFEYKQEKYGWTKEKFDVYNASRAVTLENCVDRHGEEVGTKIFLDYCERQKYVGCAKEYFIEKYGEELGTQKYLEVNAQKSLTVENFIRKYGEIDGPNKFRDYYENRSSDSYSKVSQVLFDAIYERMNNKDHVHYATLNKEFTKYDNENKRCYFYDFVCSQRQKVIEFNGITYHAKSQTDESFRNPFNVELTAKEVYDTEQIKLDLIKNLGFEVFIVWEDLYYQDREGLLKECLEFLGDYHD